MSRAYTGDGRRRSSMTHATRGHQCEFCPKVSFGNGGKVAHARSHVRKGEAVELLKEYPTWPPMSTRVFVAVDDADRIERFKASGLHDVNEHQPTDAEGQA